MQTTDSKIEGKRQRKPEIRLPFRPHKSDVGEWAFDHRTALCITIIIFMLGAIVFMSAKIRLNGRSSTEGILVEFPPEPPEQTPEQKKLAQLQPEDFSDIKNMVSNENAKSELNSRLRDDRGTQADELYDEAGKVQDRIRSNREMYEKGLREEKAIRDSRNKSKDKSASQDSKVKGRVTVSFSFENPVRNSVNLTIPAYMCEGGGQVVLDVTLNKSGKVVDASVDRAQSTSDNCMRETAISAARSSRFNLDSSAPDKHRGTITYLFIPQ